MPYKLIIADHFSYMRKEAEYTEGVFATAEVAIAKAKQIVDGELEHLFKPGMTSEELFDMYSRFGEDPYIVTTADEENPQYSSWDYAKERARTLCERS